MYCQKCGKAIPDHSKFCNHCGVAQQSGAAKSSHKNTSYRGPSRFGLILLVVGVMTTYGGFANGLFRGMMATGMDLANIVTMSLIVGCYVFGIIAVFDMDDGALYVIGLGIAVVVFMVRSSGPDANLPAVPAASEHSIIQTQQSSVVQDIPAYWAEESRKLGNGGRCAVLELMSPLEDCRYLNLTLSAEGNYGSSTKGNWEIHFRIGGQWKKVATMDYSGSGEQTMTIRLDAPTTFDAVSAFPTRRGNYSYTCSYYLHDAYCDD